MFDKATLQNMREDIDRALVSVAAKYGCEVYAGNIKYDNVTATVSVSFNKKGANEMSAEQNLFNTYCRNYGFLPEHYRKPLESGGKIYYLVGFNPRARKNYCIIEKDGSKYTASPELVKATWRG